MMDRHIAADVPLIAVYNYLEVAYDFLSRSHDEEVVRRRYSRSDRALLWLGDPKLAFVTMPVPHADYVRERLGYANTEVIAPMAPSTALSLDILAEPRLLERLLEYAGPARTVQLVPYATTPEFLHLAATLRRDYGLNVLLPESPSPDCLWVRDYADTKAGFRTLAERWLSHTPDWKSDWKSPLLPEGIVCRTFSQVVEVAHWFGQRGKACVVKADTGGSGLGHTLLWPDEGDATDSVMERLLANDFLQGDLILVEEYIQSSAQMSPSLEFFVPALGRGKPHITYLSNQLFDQGFGRFSGVILSREFMETSWYPIMAASGQVIAEQLQALGYVGHFDLDAVVDDEDRIYLLEINTRRTGGTHVHEFACFAFGPTYLGQSALISHNSLACGTIDSFDGLLAVIGDLLYPIGSEKRGVVVTVSSTLPTHEFGCIIVGPTAAAATVLEQELRTRMEAAGRPAAQTRGEPPELTPDIPGGPLLASGIVPNLQPRVRGGPLAIVCRAPRGETHRPVNSPTQPKKVAQP